MPETNRNGHSLRLDPSRGNDLAPFLVIVAEDLPIAENDSEAPAKIINLRH